MTSFSDLKTAVDELNREITDSTAAAFMEKVAALQTEYRDDRSISILTKMMQSLGKYISFKKEAVHEDTLPALNEIIATLEDLLSENDRDPDNTDDSVADIIREYKILQNKIASKPDLSEAELSSLKEAILAIDWEISETTLEIFERVIQGLLSDLKPYRIHHTFLRIIETTGKYIRSRKAAAHPDSASFLQTTFDSFEQMTQTPNLSYDGKKQLLDTAINKFMEFKQKISAPAQPLEPVSLEEADDGSVSPALSHLRPAGTTEGDDFAPLTTLSNESGEPVRPALSGKKSPKKDDRDVMDDLFSLKDSPADELLDAIHLMDVHGKGPEQALKKLDGEDTTTSEGARRFTPERMDKDPIPEIEDRLDAFFDLDFTGSDTGALPEAEPAPAQTPPGLESETPADTADDDAGFDTPSLEEDGTDDGLVPFEDDEEIRTAEDVGTGQSPGDRLNALQAALETSQWSESDSGLSAVQTDIDFLRETWKEDPDKRTLLDIVSLLVRRTADAAGTFSTPPGAPAEAAADEGDEKTAPDDESETDLEAEPSEPSPRKGFLGKFKSMFGS